jgi:uncharacterized protein (TIGR00730 family)
MTQDKTRGCENEETFEIVEDALRNLWTVANELSRIQPPQPKFFRVTIFGSARVKPGQPLYEEVKELARQLAEMGCDIVTGGGPGLMQAANEGEHLGDPSGATRSIGLPIHLPFEDGANPFVEKMYMHRTFFSRLHQFVRLSSAFIVVDGGIGTTLEALLVWQLLQVRHIDDVPLIFLGKMWEGLLDWARQSMLSSDPPFANAEDLDIPTCALTVEDAVNLIRPLKARFDAAR